MFSPLATRRVALKNITTTASKAMMLECNNNNDNNNDTAARTIIMLAYNDKNNNNNNGTGEIVRWTYERAIMAKTGFRRDRSRAV